MARVRAESESIEIKRERERRRVRAPKVPDGSSNGNPYSRGRNNYLVIITAALAPRVKRHSIQGAGIHAEGAGESSKWSKAGHVAANKGGTLIVRLRF